ncbi:uromodulin-like [Rhinoderma darwinii]|uniref:uromodulin-like n=1 Tax=Rhinoderma darwinii TaxID=43563 RepID=UPI003F66F0A0
MKLLCLFLLVAALKYTDAACYNGTIVECDSCGGSCTTNECFCLNGLDPCVPTTQNNCPSQVNSCCPLNYYYNRTAPCCTDQVLCNPPCADDEMCKGETCVCDTSIYKNKTIKDLKPSVQCDSDIMLVSMSRCLLTSLKFDYTTIALANNSGNCGLGKYFTTENNIIIDHIQVELKSGWCGNIMTNDTEKVYISNTIHVDILNSPLITVNPLRFNFTCAYNRSMSLTLNFALHPVVGTTTLPGINGTGSYGITMAAFWDDQFSNPIKEGEMITVGTDFFLGLVVDKADGDVLTLRVEKCVASGTNSTDSTSVTFMNGGCAVESDISAIVEENGQSLQSRIRISAFKFEATETVFIFCNVRMCDKSSDCHKCDNSSIVRSASDTRQIVLPLPYENYDFTSSSVSHSALPWTVLCTTVLGFLSVKLY